MREFETEALLQVAAFRWWKQHFRRISLLFAVPNGGTRDVREAKNLKDQGATAGVYDLVLAAAGGQTHYIEMKNGKQSLRSDQVDFKIKMQYLGHSLHECYSLADFKAIVCKLLSVDPALYP